MKWLTHQTGAVIAAMALEMPLPGIMAACAGAVLPDVIDQRVSALGVTRRQRQKIFNKIHRGPSHWPGWWLAFFLAAIFAPLPPAVRDIAAGLAFGSLSHVILDMLTTRGIPLLPFAKKGKLSLGLCSTGKFGEYVFLTLMCCSAAFMFKDRLLGLF